MEELAKQGAIELVVPYQLHSLEGADGQLSAVNVATLEGTGAQAGGRRPAAVLRPRHESGADRPLGPQPRPQPHHGLAGESAPRSAPGIFAIGDIATYPGKLKLILCGFSEAAMAAHAIYPLVHPGEALHFEYSTTKGVPGAA